MLCVHTKPYLPSLRQPREIDRAPVFALVIWYEMDIGLVLVINQLHAYLASLYRSQIIMYNVWLANFPTLDVHP